MWDEIMDLAARVRPTHHLADSFQPVTLVAAATAVVGAAASDPLIAWLAAIVAGGAVVVPRFIDWYRSIRAAKRAEDAADIADHARLLELEVIRRAELEIKFKEAEVRSRQIEDECLKLREETKNNRHKLVNHEQTIVLLKAENERLGKSVGKLGSVVRTITPDPDRVPQPEEPTP